jgi:hypothetical protein
MASKNGPSQRVPIPAIDLRDGEEGSGTVQELKATSFRTADTAPLHPMINHHLVQA